MMRLHAESHRSDQSGTQGDRGPTSLPALLDGWVAAGIITPEQAALIRERDEELSPAGPAHGPVPTLPRATEALGYLGGVVVVVGAVFIGDRYWEDWSLVVRLAVLGGVAAALLGAGIAVPERLGAAGRRLRSVLWLATLAAWAGFLAVLGDQALDLTAARTVDLTAAGTAAAAAGLWWAHRSFVQQAATMVALMATAAALVADLAEPDELPGVGVWLVAAGWLVLALTGRLGPTRAARAASAAAMVVGSLMTLPTDAGFLLAIATVAAVVALAIRTGDLVVLGVGALGTLGVLPAAIAEWFPDSDAVPFVVLGTGLLLVGVSVWTARRGRLVPHRPPRP
jgi:hypothetical protein